MPPSPPTDRRPAHTALLALAVALLTFALFAPAARNGFVRYDDDLYLTGNEVVGRGLTLDGVRWAFTAGRASNWHPVTWLSHMLDVQLFGLAPGPHHLVGAALHGLNAGLLVLALWSLTGERRPALLAALFFAVHPLRVESVAWASERKDLLAGLFWMLGLLAWSAWVRRGGAWRYAAVVAALALGLLSKPMLVTFPLVLLALDVWPLGRWRRGGTPLARLVLEKAPLFALAAASGAVTVWAQAASGAVRPLATLPLDARLSNACVASVGYVTRSLWPSGLAVFYPHPALVAPASYRPFGIAALACAALVVVAGAAALAARRRHGYLTLGWAWTAITLLPVVGLVQVGEQAAADRYTYLPLIGLAVALAWGLERGLARRPELTGLALAGAAVWLALLGRATLRQIRVWRDTTTLFERALAVTEANYVAHQNLGLELLDQGRPDAAAQHLEAALAIRPDDPKLLHDLGLVELRRGRPREAAELLRRTTEVLPGLAEAHVLLGVALARSGEPRRALEPLQRAIALDPADSRAHANLATVHAALGDLEAALRAQRRALELASDEQKAEQRARLEALEARARRERGS